MWAIGVAVLCVIAFTIRLSVGAIDAPMLAQPVRQALANNLPPGWRAEIASTALSISTHGPALIAEGLEIREPNGSLLLQTRSAEISLDPLSLILGEVRPVAVAVAGVEINLLIMPDGRIQATARDNALKAEEEKVLEEQLSAPSAQGASSTPSQQSDEKNAPDGQPVSPAPASPALDRALLSLVDLLSGRSGFANSPGHLSISEARLVLTSVNGTPGALSKKTVFDHIAFDLDRTHTGAVDLSLSLQAGGEKRSIRGHLTPPSDTVQTLDINLDPIPLSDLLLLGGLSGGSITGDMPISAGMRLSVQNSTAITDLNFDVRGAAGTLIYDDKDQPPIAIGSLALEGRRDKQDGNILLDKVELLATDTRFELAGKLDLAPVGAKWALALTGKDGLLPGPGKDDPSLKLDTISLQASGVTSGGARVDRLAVSGNGFGLALSGEMGTQAAGEGLMIGVTAARSAARPILYFWPEFVAVEARRFLIENLHDGIIEQFDAAVRLDKATLAATKRKEPIPDDTVRVRFSGTDIALNVAPGLPLLSGASLQGLVTGTTAVVEVSEGLAVMDDGGEITLRNGRMSVDSLVPPINGKIVFRMTSAADAFAALLVSEALRPMFNLDMNPDSIDGQADLQVTLELPFAKDLKPEQIKAEAKGKLTNLTMAVDGSSEKLEKADLSLTLGLDKLAIEGTGSFAEIPAQIRFMQPLRQKAGEAEILLTLDKAVRVRKGIDLGDKLTGPVTARVKTAVGRGKSPLIVELDLARAGIANLLPGWNKPVGKPGRASFVAQQQDGVILSDLVVEAGLTARGDARLHADGSLHQVNLKQIRVSGSDDLSATIVNDKGLYRATVRGNLLDARPWIRFAQNNNIGMGQGAASGRKQTSLRLDLDLAVNIVAGYNSEALSNVKTKLSWRGARPSAFAFNGQIDGAPFTVSLAQSADNPSINIETTNAGGILRLIDLYDYMRGGHMQMNLAMGGSADSLLMIRDFAISNEPAMSRILTESPKKFQVDPGNVPFTKLRVTFSPMPERINIREAVLWGPNVGVTLEGHLNTKNDTVDLSGTYVPAYALNNMFSQIPLLGPLLGGGKYEGLFAINFRVQGRMETPAVTINPLSAIAPGIFRKFFDLGRADSG